MIAQTVEFTLILKGPKGTRKIEGEAKHETNPEINPGDAMIGFLKKLYAAGELDGIHSFSLFAEVKP